MTPAVKSKGFTLMELIITLVLVSLLAAIAVPSFTALTTRTRAESAANELASLLKYARSIAAQSNASHVACQNGADIYVQRGVTCNNTGVLRTLAPESGVTFSASANAFPMVFSSNGTTANAPSIIVCRNSSTDASYKLTIQNSGQIRLWPKGKSETGSAITSCTL